MSTTDDPCDCRSAVVPAVKRPVLDDDVAWLQHHLAVVELEADGSIQDDVEVRPGGRVHRSSRPEVARRRRCGIHRAAPSCRANVAECLRRGSERHRPCPTKTWKRPPALPYAMANASSSLTTAERPRSSCPVTSLRTTPSPCRPQQTPHIVPGPASSRHRQRPCRSAGSGDQEGRERDACRLGLPREHAGSSAPVA